MMRLASLQKGARVEQQECPSWMKKENQIGSAQNGTQFKQGKKNMYSGRQISHCHENGVSNAKKRERERALIKKKRKKEKWGES
jgi:hypothetical protein